jgi:hypothetical protein
MWELTYIKRELKESQDLTHTTQPSRKCYWEHKGEHLCDSTWYQSYGFCGRWWREGY